LLKKVGICNGMGCHLMGAIRSSGCTAHLYNSQKISGILQEQVHSVLQMLLCYDIPVLQGDYLDINIPDSDIIKYFWKLVGY